MTTLPRDLLHWDDDARHEVEERKAMRVEHVTRPLTAAEVREVDAWAEQDVRRAYHLRAGLPREVDHG